MRSPSRTFSVVIWTFALVCLLMPLAASDKALVVRKANLRKDSSAQHTPIRVLLPDEELAILDDSTSPRYLKVKTDEKKTGWVWKNAPAGHGPEPTGHFGNGSAARRRHLS